MTQDRSDQAEGNRHHDNHRLDVGSELAGQQKKNTHHRKHIPAFQTINGLAGALLLPFQIKGDTRIALDQFGQEIGFQVGHNPAGVSSGFINIGYHRNGSFAIHPIDDRIGPAVGDIGHLF